MRRTGPSLAGDAEPGLPPSPLLRFASQKRSKTVGKAQRQALSNLAIVTMRFLATDESKRLARWLRLAGTDVECMPAQPLSALYQRAHNEARIILSRNGRVKTGGLVRVVQLRSHQLEAQLTQVIRETGLAIDDAALFTRCDRCNVELEALEKPNVKDRVPPYVYQTQEEFHACPSCKRIYWAATHWERAVKFFERLKPDA